jgi:predicted transcriptional regulator
LVIGFDNVHAAEPLGRAQPNLLRTLAKLEALGLIEMHAAGKRKIPIPRVRKLRVDIDPFSPNDKLEIA